MESSSQEIKKFVRKQIRKDKEKGKLYPRLTENELIAVLVRVGNGKYLSEKKYNSLRSPGDPNSLTYHRRFKGWKVAAEMAWGKKPQSPSDFFKENCDERYCVKLVLEFNLTSRKEYLKKHKEFPYVFPSVIVIQRYFKNFTNLFLAAEHCSVSEQLSKCLSVRLELKKSPTLEEYNKYGINTSVLLKRFGSLKEINARVRTLEEAYEIKRRDSVQNVEPNGKIFEREKKEMFKPISFKL